jgi:hypothetical protein
MSMEVEMNEEERNARWQAIMDAQAEIVSEPVPLRPAREGEPARTRDRKSQQFNEALSGLGSWSSVEPSRRRLSA